MSEQENINIARKSFDNLNSHNLDANNPLFADNIRVEAPSISQPMNKEQGQMYTRRFLDAFPDLHFTLKDIVAQGDKVAISWEAHGTHTKPMATMMGDNIPPTNRKVTVPGATFYEFHNNLITRQELYWDQVTFMTQLGVLTEQDMMARTRR